MPPQPPQGPKKKTGLWIGVSVGVVAVAAFLVTAFLAPGFLLSDDSGSDVSGGDVSGSDSAAGSDTNAVDFGDSEAAAVAEQVAAGFANGDTQALNEVMCPGSEVALRGFADEAPMVTQFEVTGNLEETQQNPPSYSFTASMTLEAEGEVVNATPTFTVTNVSGSWCWSEVGKKGS